MTTKRKSENNIESLETPFKKMKINETKKRKENTESSEIPFKKMKINETKKRKIEENIETIFKKLKIDEQIKINTKVFTIKDLCLSPIIHTPQYVF